MQAVIDDDTGNFVTFGVFGDNYGYRDCDGCHTKTIIPSDQIFAKNDIILVYEDYKAGTYNLVKLDVITATLNKVSIEQGKIWVGN